MTDIDEMLDEMFGVFVCDALNRLYQQEESCCPECCGVCGVLRDLDFHGILNLKVKKAPEFSWKDVAWWKNNRVDRDWLYDSWSCQNSPQCDLL